MHPELKSAKEKRQALIEKMNKSGAFDSKAFAELEALSQNIDLMEKHPVSVPEPEPNPAQPSLELDEKPKRAAKL